jgi:GNAT superfamily N-acetyltransferase
VTLKAAPDLETLSHDTARHRHGFTTAWRGRDLGTALMEWVSAQGARWRPSVTLYRRLGFHEIADQGVHWDMEWGI